MLMRCSQLSHGKNGFKIQYDNNYNFYCLVCLRSYTAKVNVCAVDIREALVFDTERFKVSMLWRGYVTFTRTTTKVHPYIFSKNLYISIFYDVRAERVSCEICFCVAAVLMLWAVISIIVICDNYCCDNLSHNPQVMLSLHSSQHSVSTGGVIANRELS